MNDIFHVFQNQNFIDLCMYQFGYAQNDPLSSFGPHIRSHYLFHYVISGAGKLQATDAKGCDHTYYIRSGQGFLIVPEQITTYTADEAHPWEYTWIEFDGMHAKEAMMVAGLTINNPVYRSDDKMLTSKLKETMLYIVHHEKETPFHLMSHLYTLLDEVHLPTGHVLRCALGYTLLDEVHLPTGHVLRCAFGYIIEEERKKSIFSVFHSVAV